MPVHGWGMLAKVAKSENMYCSHYSADCDAKEEGCRSISKLSLHFDEIICRIVVNKATDPESEWLASAFWGRSLTKYIATKNTDRSDCPYSLGDNLENKDMFPKGSNIDWSAWGNRSMCQCYSRSGRSWVVHDDLQVQFYRFWQSRLPLPAPDSLIESLPRQVATHRSSGPDLLGLGPLLDLCFYDKLNINRTSSFSNSWETLSKTGFGLPHRPHDRTKDNTSRDLNLWVNNLTR